MKCKIKNPYLSMDMNMDNKYLSGMCKILKSYHIDLTNNCTGIFINEDIVGTIDTEQEYEECPWAEMSIYEAFDCIPEGMRYDEELDKLVPDVIIASNEYCSGIKVEFEKVLEYSEEILQRENGFIKADKEKINFSLVDPYAYEDLGKCLTIGAKKYSPDNWKLGDIESYIAALDRHLIDIKKAVLDKDKSLFIDKDTTLQHGANLLCNAMFIHYFIRKELKEDKC